MTGATRLKHGLIVLAAFAVLTIWTVVYPSLAVAQQGSAGNNDVYNSSGSETGSTAFIDASVFAKGTTTICSVLFGVLSSSSYTPAVIDARGLNSANTNMTCDSNWTPWYNPNTQKYANVPSTILLPAGVITIPTTWVLPNSTRVIGEGSTDPFTLSANAALPQTTIQACTTPNCTTAFSGGTMIQFGDNTCAAPGCTRVTFEDVTLNGSGQGINGIVNSNSQELSYAKNVVMYQVLGIGLEITGNAENSGPYTNITYDTGSSGVSSSTCASISSSVRQF